MRLLLDTNIILDAIIKREPFNQVAKEFFTATVRYRDELYVCTSSLKDLSYIMHKYVHSNETTNNLLIDIYSRVTKVVGITTDDTIEALYEDGDYEDNLIALTAETNMCDAVITRDKNFKNFRVVLTPEEYLRYKSNVNEL